MLMCEDRSQCRDAHLPVRSWVDDFAALGTSGLRAMIKRRESSANPLGEVNAVRSADLVLTLRWTSQPVVDGFFGSD